MFTQNDILNHTYQIVGQIGKGGTGVVYLAYHLRLQKYVVVKRIQEHFSEDISGRREADILKNLHHPCLPQIYDFVQDSTGVYTVMDYIQGVSLQSYLQEPFQRLEERQLLHWFRQMTDVLVYLHGQKPPVVHSDIKPENILITPEGNAVLIDFNISLDGTNKKILGYTVPYAAPEQMAAARDIAFCGYSDRLLDGRIDIYSLGATFYHLIRGVPPEANGTIRPLTQCALPYSEAFLSLVDRIMEYEPGKRPAHILKVRQGLDRLRRSNAQYRLYFAEQCISLLLSALLLGGGVFCGIQSLRLGREEDYAGLYASVFQELSRGNEAGAEQVCFHLLNSSEYSSLLQRRSEDRAVLYHALGDIAYSQEQYSNAVAYYSQAMEEISEEDSKLVSQFCRDTIAALAQSGRLEEALALLAEEENEGLTDEDLLLVKIILCPQRGTFTSCTELSTQYLRSYPSNPEDCARVCVATAEAAPEPKEAILWLEKAQEFDKSRTTLRALAEGYVKCANCSIGNEALHYLKLADKLYVELAKKPYPLKVDRINQAAVQRMMGNGDQAIRILTALMSEGGEDYRVLMQLAFAYEQTGRTLKASEYSGRALAAWKDDQSENRLSESDSNIQNLIALYAKYHT